jgi:hypothetical protein
MWERGLRAQCGSFCATRAWPVAYTPVARAVSVSVGGGGGGGVTILAVKWQLP